MKGMILVMANVYFSKEDLFKDKESLGVNIPYSPDTSILSEPLKIKGKTIPNRLACQPMEGCDGTSDGRPDELTLRRYDRFAKGGAGLIWYEATAVMKEARANPRQLYLTTDNISSFERQVYDIKNTCVKENGYEPVIIMQATHSGRYSKPEGVPAPIIAYNNEVLEKDNPIDKSRIVTDEYLDSVKEALVNSSVLAKKAGFDGVDIKCCHRYLNSELLSAYQREGRYGGSLENRTRLLREAVEGAIQSTGSDFIVTSRLNVYDGYIYPWGFGVDKSGSLEFDATEPIWLLKELNKLGVELIDISMGNPYFNPHTNRPFAQGPYEAPEHPLKGVERMLNGTKLLKENVPDMKFIASGITFLGTTAPNVCAGYIKENGFDMAGFGRTIFAYPDFAKDIVNNGCMEKAKCCIACSKCTVLMRSGSTPGCVIKDKLYTDLFREVVLNK